MRATVFMRVWMLGAAASMSAEPSFARPGLVEEIAVDEQQERGLLAVAGEGFSLRRTPHFVVAYDTDEGIVEDMAIRLERTYRGVYQFLGVIKFEARKPDRRLEVILFDEPGAYERYAARSGFPAAGTCGFYHQGTNRSALVNAASDPALKKLHASIAAAQSNVNALAQAVESAKDERVQVAVEFADGQRLTLSSNEARSHIESTRKELEELARQVRAYSGRLNQTVVQHEIAHQILFNAGVHAPGANNPKWVVEGLATVFETPPSERGSGFGVTNAYRLDDLRRAVSGESGRARFGGEDFAAAISAGRLASPMRLICDASLFDMRGEAGASHYALAWSLMYYLQRARREDLGQYLKVLSRRDPAAKVAAGEESALFERYFGPVDDAFVKRWGGYILGLPVYLPEGEKP